MNEPPALPPEPGDLRALLEDAPYIDDAGFSARVALALPRQTRPRSIAYAVIPSSAALGCLLTYALSPRSLPSHAGALPWPALSVVLSWSFFAPTFALLLVAWATLLTPATDE